MDQKKHDALRQERESKQIAAIVTSIDMYGIKGDDIYYPRLLSDVHEFGFGADEKAVKDALKEMGYEEYYVPIVDKYEPRTELRWRKRGDKPQVCTFF